MAINKRSGMILLAFSVDALFMAEGSCPLEVFFDRARGMEIAGFYFLSPPEARGGYGFSN